jgi:hypothetical protein
MKANKQASVDRKKALNKANETKVNRPAKGQDSAKVHNTKGKNTHGRRYQ